MGTDKFLADLESKVSLSYNTTLYHIIWDDTPVLVNDAATAAFDFITNFGEAEITGTEIENATASFTDARLKDDQPDELLSLDQGHDRDVLAHVPQWSASAGVTNYREFGWGWNWMLHADWSFTGSSVTRINEDITEYAEKSSYSLLNAKTDL